MSALGVPPPSEEDLYPVFCPPVPETVEETGLDPSLLEQTVTKFLYYRGESIGRDIGRQLGLNFSVIDGTMEFLKRQHLVEIKRAYGMGNVSSYFTLSEAGRNLALAHLEKNTYADRAPVPLAQYVEGVRAQKWQPGWLTKQMLYEAYGHMVLKPAVLNQVGPAVNSGKSFLIYGRPGNGKTYLAEALFQLDPDPIFVPYAIECQGQIIQMYDPIYHGRIDDEEAISIAFSEEPRYDQRWFRCRRPFLMTGGELTLDMLDLKFSETSRTYDAPFQLKANNGIYLIDDFGRQKVSPAEVLNRWIVPMERRVDFLTLHTGGKMMVPFEAFLVFSTNLQPEQLGDEAFLRRIQYKMHLGSPDEEEFLEIFNSVCQRQGLSCGEEAVDRLVEESYRKTGKPMRRCHPRDILAHAVDYLNFEELPYELTWDVLRHAVETCFVQTVVEA